MSSNQRIGKNYTVIWPYAKRNFHATDKMFQEITAGSYKPTIYSSIKVNQSTADYVGPAAESFDNIDYAGTYPRILSAAGENVERQPLGYFWLDIVYAFIIFLGAVFGYQIKYNAKREENKENNIKRAEHAAHLNDIIKKSGNKWYQHQYESIKVLPSSIPNSGDYCFVMKHVPKQGSVKRETLLRKWELFYTLFHTPATRGMWTVYIVRMMIIGTASLTLIATAAVSIFLWVGFPLIVGPGIILGTTLHNYFSKRYPTSPAIHWMEKLFFSQLYIPVEELEDDRVRENRSGNFWKILDFLLNLIDGLIKLLIRVPLAACIYIPSVCLNLMYRAAHSIHRYYGESEWMGRLFLNPWYTPLHDKILQHQSLARKIWNYGCKYSDEAFLLLVRIPIALCLYSLPYLGDRIFAAFGFLTTKVKKPSNTILNFRKFYDIKQRIELMEKIQAILSASNEATAPSDDKEKITTILDNLTLSTKQKIGYGIANVSLTIIITFVLLQFGILFWEQCYQAITAGTVDGTFALPLNLVPGFAIAIGIFTVFKAVYNLWEIWNDFKKYESLQKVSQILLNKIDKNPNLQQHKNAIFKHINEQAKKDHSLNGYQKFVNFKSMTMSGQTAVYLIRALFIVSTGALLGFSLSASGPLIIGFMIGAFVIGSGVRYYRDRMKEKLEKAERIANLVIETAAIAKKLTSPLANPPELNASQNNDTPDWIRTVDENVPSAEQWTEMSLLGNSRSHNSAIEIEQDLIPETPQSCSTFTPIP